MKTKEMIAEEIDCWKVNNDVDYLGYVGVRPEDHVDAIIGIVSEPKPSIIYGYERLVRSFMRVHNWSHLDALEWVNYNEVRGIMYNTKAKNPPQIIDDSFLEMWENEASEEEKAVPYIPDYDE